MLSSKVSATTDQDKSMDFAATGKERRIFGVDFSGAKDACKKIWISSAKPVGNTLYIEECYRLADRIGSTANSRSGRDECFSALRSLIVREIDAVFGIDLSFSLPESLMEDSWEGFIESFSSNYPSAEQFRESCRDKAAGKEIKRASEIRAKVPFSVYNLRLYRQTYFGIRDVISPLVRDNLACVLPMQEARDGKAWLIEICPACRLKKEDMYIAYKGKTDDRRIARCRILEYFMSKGIVIPSSLQELIVDDTEGDALDSIIATYSTFRSLSRLSEISDTLPENYTIEGYTFF
ncbi:hypothetical protein RE474_08025 [Methanolobus sediminis]|uniref:DUF429 domain-containing protein n=1 Tax=Methanolobus sediminis TaxID=3072978 RepID=A0AA51UJ30_9EURY|nr:hypothetical protein [Methanolobus sediminis]WMW24048.1 hypothetical protein RE474_08025 [Methanolobus sediminis]